MQWNKNKMVLFHWEGFYVQTRSKQKVVTHPGKQKAKNFLFDAFLVILYTVFLHTRDAFLYPHA